MSTKKPFVPVVKRRLRVDAICIHCKRHGKSQFPDHYQCSKCYYTAMSRSALDKASQLEEKAVRLRKEAQMYADKAAQFK